MENGEWGFDTNFSFYVIQSLYRIKIIQEMINP